MIEGTVCGGILGVRWWEQRVTLLSVAAALFLSQGCSIRTLAVNSLGEALAEGASVYASDNDPDLVREALPFNLKTLETLLVSAPENRGLLLSACSTFTLYAAGFVQADAEVAEWADFDYARAEALTSRALNLFVRARDYCLRRLELDHPGMSERLRLEPATAVHSFDVDDVETLYWLGGSWGLAISIGLDRPALSADLPAVRALMERALVLDEDYNRGALHAAFITLESVPDLLGGSPARAREHFDRAVELTGGGDASVFISLATGVSRPAQDRDEFESLLQMALAIDPDADTSIRLANLVAQRRARLLLDHVDELFDPPL